MENLPKIGSAILSPKSILYIFETYMQVGMSRKFFIYTFQVIHSK